MSRRPLAPPARHASARLSVAAGVTACLALASAQGLAQPKPPATTTPLPSTPAAAEQPGDPECLTVTQSSASTYTISNTACADESVLASIELADSGNLARCFVKKIRTQISIASEGSAPVINYQCLEGATGCSFEAVRDMFPECHAG